MGKVRYVPIDICKVLPHRSRLTSLLDRAMGTLGIYSPAEALI